MSKPDPARFATPALWLASQSPRRAQLLTQLGVPHEVMLPPDADAAEALEAPLSGEMPSDYVQRVTQAKLRASMAHREAVSSHGITQNGESVEYSCLHQPLLCADTTVALGSSILGKPESAADAARMLHQLQGATHQVFTAVAVAWRDARVAALSASLVSFAPMSDADITTYVASGEPMGKAGAYGIQGLAAQHIARIDGSYTGIMGLPLFETAQLLKHLGWWR